MTVLVAEVTIDQHDYEVEYDGLHDEFAMYRVLVPGFSRQIGDPKPLDRQFFEYSQNDFDDMVRTALGQSHAGGDV